MTAFTLWMIVSNTAFWLIVCFGSAYAVRYLPDSWYKASYFEEKPLERRLYRTLRINSWKDRLPEWGSVFHFEKKNLREDLDLVYLRRFIMETYYSESGHSMMAVLGFGCLLLNPASYSGMALMLA